MNTLKIIALVAVSTLLLAATAEANEGPLCRAFDAIPAKHLKTPTVDWMYYVLPSDQIGTYCGDSKANGCAYPNADGSWTVIVAESVTGYERICLIQTAMSRMPPNR